MKKEKAKPKNYINRQLFFYVLFLTAVGLLAVADASAPLAMRQFDDKFFFVRQQLVAAVIGLVAMVVLSFINYKIWEKIAVVAFFVSVLLLVLVLIPGFGSKLLGARRWLILGPINFQPSEIVKLTLCMYIAKVATTQKKIFAYFFPLVLVGGLVMLQPDLGTAMVLVAIGMVQVFYSGVNILYFIGFSLLGAFSSVILIFTSDYRRERLMSFISHSQNNEVSYHIRQVLLAIGSGGLFGVGLGQSRQKFLFIPESASDSIFAIIAEEAGFLRATVLMCVYLLFILNGLRIASKVEDKFGKILATGIVSWVGIQTIFNLSSMLSITPIVGVPLPFISYGGTSIATLLVAMGILLNISRYAKN